MKRCWSLVPSFTRKFPELAQTPHFFDSSENERIYRLNLRLNGVGAVDQSLPGMQGNAISNAEVDM